MNALNRTSLEQRETYMQAIRNVMDSGWFLMGPETEYFEDELSLFVGAKNAITVANGTDALEIALAALGVGRGDTVLTVANAGFYASLATRSLGATPVYCDVDADSLLMSASSLEDCLKQLDHAPAAIVVTHLYGALAPMDELMQVAIREKVPVVEDCAQALGIEDSTGGRVGTFGEVATTSFYPTKNLGAFGDAGALFTNNDDLAHRIRSLRQYGWKDKYEVTESGGTNSRMDEIQAAILRIRLPELFHLNERRKEVHVRYEQCVSRTARVLNNVSKSFNAHLAVLIAENRSGLRISFEASGVSTAVHYPIPDHSQPLMSANFRPNAPLEVTEWACQKVLSIPCFPEMYDTEINVVAGVLEAR